MRISIITAFALACGLTAGGLLASACTDVDPLPTAEPLATPIDEWIQPSCIPNPPGDGDYDDGQTCAGSGDDNFCDIVPNPFYYCVTCTAGGSGCYSYPPDA